MRPIDQTRLRRAVSAMSLAIAFAMQAPAYAQTAAGQGENHALESYARGRAVLDAGIAAIGGAEALAGIGSVRRELTVKRMDPAQARGAWSGERDIAKMPVYSQGVMSSTLDYAGNRMRVHQRDEETPGEASLFTEVAIPGQSFSLVSMRAETPFLQLVPNGAARARHARETLLHPEALLKAALARAQTLQWSGRSTLDGAAVDVISFVDPQGGRYFLFFDAGTRRLLRCETVSDHPVLGDSNLSTSFSDYRQAGPLTLPHRIITMRNNRPARDYRLVSAAFNLSLNEADFAPPPSAIAAVQVPDAPLLEARGNGVYEVRGAYNAMFAVFRDYVVLSEAPSDEGYTRQVFALIRSVAPGKPVKVVATHFHFDHIGGIRYAAAVADEIWATADAKTEIERALGYPRSIRPDEYSRAPKPVVFKLIGKRHIFADATQRVEFADIGPGDHAHEMLIGYFPGAATLLAADVLDVYAPDMVLTSGDTELMMRRVRALGWKPEQVLPVHGVAASMASLERSLAARADYLKRFAAGQTDGARR